MLVWLFACLFVCLLVGLSACLFICLFVCLSVQLNIGLCVCLSFFSLEGVGGLRVGLCLPFFGAHILTFLMVSIAVCLSIPYAY